MRKFEFGRTETSSNRVTGTDIVKRGGVDQDCTTFLVALLDGLEASRGQLGQLSDADGQSQILGFAMKIFKRADDVYRAGKANKKTGKALYAAGNFLTVLKQFGPMDKKLDNLRKYALISASRILKCLRNNQRPIPPEGVSDTSPDLPSAPGYNDKPSTTTNGLLDIPAAPGFGDSDTKPSTDGLLDIPAAPGFGDSDTKPSTNGLLDIPAAPGFGDSDTKPSTNGFLDIPAAPGFGDSDTKPSTNGLLDIPAAPGFGDSDTKPSTNGFLDIPAAPGFGDSDTKPTTNDALDIPAAPGFDDVPVAPSTSRTEVSKKQDDGAAGLIRKAEEFEKAKKYKRSLDSYVEALNLMMNALGSAQKGSPAHTKLLSVITGLMGKAEMLKKKLKNVPDLSDEFRVQITTWQGIPIGKRFGADAVLLRALQLDQKEYYGDAVDAYEEALGIYIQKVLKSVDSKFKPALYKGLEALMSRAEKIKKAL